MTVLDAPPMFVLGIRAYSKGYSGKETMKDVWAYEIPKDLQKKLNISKEKNPEKKLDEIAKKDNLVDVYAIICTQPALTSLPKKKPDLMEIAIGGELPYKVEYAKKILGKTVSIKDVFQENTFADVCAVTKGKGFKGPVKRWGI